MEEHASDITTVGTVLGHTHASSSGTLLAAARRELLERYGPTVRRYLLDAAGDTAVAEELFQEFALRLLRGDFHGAELRGDFHGADRDRSRFRFLKTAARDMVNDLHRRDGGSSESAPTVSVGIAPAHGARDEERERGRRALLRHVWGALKEAEHSSGKPLYTILRLRARHPDLESTELARLASAALGREVTAGNIRVVLHRARARFVDRLLREISHSIESTDPAAIEAELAELRLLEYCRGALRNWCARRAALAGLQRGRPTSVSGSGRGATGRGASGL